MCGGVFASPPTSHIVKAIKHISNPLGVLVVIKNYTGDIVNFECAASYSITNGINVKTLVVNDDIAFMDKDPSRK